MSGVTSCERHRRELVVIDPTAKPESRPASLKLPDFGEIVDFDYLEVESPWRLPAAEANSILVETTRAAPLKVIADSSAHAVHPDHFRQALAHLPAPVTLVTCAGPDEAPVGATVSAFSSLSLDPPLVVLSLDHRSGTLAAIRSRGAFAVHVLGDNHRPLAIHFAERRSNKFQELEFSRNKRGVPLLSSYSFRFECALHDEFPGGDHVVVVGAVEELSEHDVSQEPVVWYARAFQRLLKE